MQKAKKLSSTVDGEQGTTQPTGETINPINNLNKKTMTKNYFKSNINEKKVLTAEQFVGMEAGFGYYEPQQLIAYLAKLYPGDGDSLVLLFDGMKNGDRLSLSPRIMIDKGGNAYTYSHFAKSKGSKSLKIVSDQPLNKLIEDYLNGNVTINFSWVEIEALLDQI